MKSNSLSDRIINHGSASFKLWLEFEISSPWDNIENDFANIIVNTLDGRNYGINVWTFKFLNTVQEKELQEGNSNYIIPPDLFVKELSRDCIEKTIKILLNEGNLENILNTSIFGLHFLEPYWDAVEMEEKNIQTLMEEFTLELPDNHILHKEPVELIAKKINNDGIVLELQDGRIAVVHLTWQSKKESRGYPTTRIYKDKIDFWNKEMKQDILEFKR